jgi:DNA-binding response OmpR family regulator
MTILIIDDSRFLQVAVEKILREAGYRTVVVSDGDAGLRAAIQKSPDLILLDIMLPSLPGTSVLHSLKHNPVTSGIPVIVLSGLTRLDEARLKSDGADGYLAKSELDLESGGAALLTTIETIYKRRTQALV